MKYATVYRSLLEAFSILGLTLLLADDDFARLMAEIYPIYFFANVLFGAATIDFAGGRLQMNLTLFLIFLFIPALLFVLFFQDTPFLVFLLLFAGFTSVEAVCFVFSEAFSLRVQAIVLLLPRVCFALFALLSLVFMDQLDLTTVLTAFVLRDLALVLLGGAIFFLTREHLWRRREKQRISISELAYMLISVAQEHALRMLVNAVVGPTFMKEFEYALRLPRLLQTGLMLAFRHRIFATGLNRNQPAWVLASQFFMLIFSAIMLAAYILNLVGPFVMIAASSLLATSAVLWYTDQIGERRFNLLSLVVLFAFSATVITVFVLPDAYIAILVMNFALCVSAFINGMARKYAQ